MTTRNIYNKSFALPITFTENDNYGNVIIESWTSDDTPGENNLDLGNMTVNNTIQVEYPDTETNFTLNFASSPKQRVPYPEYLNFTQSSIYDTTNNTFIENDVLGQRHLWKFNFQIDADDNKEEGALAMRFYNSQTTYDTSQHWSVAQGTGRIYPTFFAYTVATEDSLPSGTGIGYNLELTTTSLVLSSVILLNVERISIPTNTKITL